jgi:hypothetical protein
MAGPGWFGGAQQEQPEEQERQQRVSGVGRPRLSLRLPDPAGIL